MVERPWPRTRTRRTQPTLISLSGAEVVLSPVPLALDPSGLAATCCGGVVAPPAAAIDLPSSPVEEEAFFTSSAVDEKAFLNS